MSTNEQVSEGTVLGGAGVTSGTDRALVIVVDGGRSIALPVTLGGGGVAIGTVAQGDPAIIAKAWPILVTDGVDTALVVAAAPGAADPGLVVRVVPAPGVDIGDVTVNNAAGASAVNIQDGGNSLTVDGTVTANQGTAAAVASSWPVLITDGTDTAQVTAALPAANINALAVRQVPTSGTTSGVTRVDVSATNVTLLALNTARISASFCNNAASANLYVKLGATASLGAGTESFTVKVPAGGLFRLNLYEYSGIVDGIWDTAEAGAECLITEITP